MLVTDVPVIPEGKEKEHTASGQEQKGKDGEKVIADEKRKSVGDVVEKPPPRSPTPPVVAAATEEAAVAQGVWGKDGL